MEGCGAEEGALFEASTSFAVEVERDAGALSPEAGQKPQYGQAWLKEKHYLGP